MVAPDDGSDGTPTAGAQRLDSSVGADDDRPIRVLHVDDDPDLAALAARFLNQLDDRITVETARSAAAGLAALEDGTFDCIVSDYEMPETNGVEFLHAVRADDPDVPFVLYTGKGSEEVASEAISAGVTDYLQKESSTEHYKLLANRIVRAVEQYRTQRIVERTRRRFRTLVEEATDAILVVDEAATITYATASAETVLGRTPEELVGTSGFEPVHPDDTDRVVEEFAELVADDDRRAVEFRYRRPDGSYIWAEARGRDLTADPVIDGFVIYTRDVTERKERELERQRQQRRFEATFADPGTLIGLVDTDGTLLEINDTALDLVDSARDEVVGTRLWETQWFANDPDEGAVAKQWIERASNGEYVEFEHDVTSPDGEVTTVEGVARPVTDEEGSVVSVLVSARDVTDESERQRRLQRQAAFLENSPDMFFVLDEEGLITYQNHTSAEILGYEMADFRGEDVTPYIHPEDREDVVADFARLLDEPDESVRDQYRFLLPNGEYHWFEYRAINRLDDPTIDGVLVISRDVTARRRREDRLEALTETSRKLMGAETREAIAEIGIEAARDVLDLPAVTLHLYDDERGGLVPVEFTDGARDLVGTPPVFEPGDSIAWRVYTAGETETIDDVAADPDAFNPDSPIASEVLVPIGDRGVMLAGSTTTDTFDQSNVLLVEILAGAIARALEQVERTEELRERERELSRQNDRLSEFASVVSHDLRNPLSVAEGRVELAREESESDHLTEAANALERMHVLIEDVLTLAREGETVSDVEAVDVGELARNCWRTIETASAHLETPTDRTILADRSRLKQLVENLVRNAIEHGGEDVTITVGDLPAGFYVADDGPGIPADERDDVFDVGYTSSADGTGFGLGIVRQVAVAHGWNVAVTEGADGGARFEITDVEFAD